MRVSKVYNRIESIIGNVITVRANGVQYKELAQINTRFGKSLAQVNKIEGDIVSLQVFAGGQGISTGDEVRAVSDTLPQSPISVADTSFLQPQISVADDSFLQPQVLSQPLLTRWTLSAKDLADPDKVKDFYRQLREDLSVLRSALRFAKEKGATDASLERLLSDTESAAGRLQDNLEFMNMLNRIFPYMQLPLRFSEKLTHGELYVYTKKEKLRNEHGSISVLLHLDMEALGPTDIYLSLAGNRLTSRFYLNDTSLETLFTEHLPELKETLALKGFAVNFELIGRKQEEDPVREFLSNHDNSGLSRFTFDCRA